MGNIVRPKKRILASQKKENSALEKCVLTSGNEDILALPEGPAPPAGPSTVSQTPQAAK